MEAFHPEPHGTPYPPLDPGLSTPAAAGHDESLAAQLRSDDTHALLLRLGREVMSITGRTRAEVLLLDRPGDRRGIAVWSGVATRERPVLQALIHLRPFLPTWSGGPALETITDLPPGDPVTAILRQLGRLLTLTLPIWAGDEVVGRVTVWSAADTRDVSAQEINAAMAVVEQAGVALAEVRRRHTSETHLVGQKALLAIARLAADRRFTAATFDEIAAVVRRATGADSAVIGLIRRGGTEVVTVADDRAAGWAARPSERGSRHVLAGDTAMVRSLAEGAPVVIDDRTPWLAGGDRDALRFAGTATRGYLPLVHEGVPLGMLRLDYRSPRVVPDDEREVSHAIAAQVAATLGAIRRQAAFRRSATIDELTGTLRRQYVRARLDAMLAGDAGASRALVLARLDGIPGINAGQGFLAGDRLLRSVANRLRRLTGLSATIGRWNGTEFVIVLTGDDIGRVTGLVGATTPALADGSPALPGGVTLRMGIALAPTDGQTVDALLGAALATMPPLPTPVVAPVKTAPGTVRDTAPLPSALTGLVRELDHHDLVGLVHAELVATLASRFATSLGLSPDQVEAIAIAGQVLDIGKLLVPAAVLRKAGPLTANERRLVQQHVALGCQMISGVAHEGMVLAAIGSHHEWWDGTGYPRRVTGDAIPLGGRILALADATAAMAMDKPYRRGRPVQDIVTELCRGAGTQFDPDLVEPFVVQLHLAANAGILGTVLVQPGPNGTGDLSRLVAV